MPVRRVPVGWILVLLLCAFALLELGLLVWLTRATSLSVAITVMVVSAVLGASFLRRQGLKALARAHGELGQGRPPARPLLDGLLILVGGTLLILPGLITDAIGLSILFPLTRRLYAKLLMGWLQRKLQGGGRFGTPFGGGAFRVFTLSNRPPSPPGGDAPSVRVIDPEREGVSGGGGKAIRSAPPPDDDIIDVDYQEKRPEQDPRSLFPRQKGPGSQ